MTQGDRELIERLREPVEDGVPIPACRLMDEAADLLASRAAEIERLREALANALASGLPAPVADAARQALKGTGADHG